LFDNWFKFDIFKGGGICSLLSSKSSLKERKIPDNLIKAIIGARNASAAKKKFHKEMDLYIKKCKSTGLKPKPQWLDLLSYLAEGRNIMSVLAALQVHPNTEEFLRILESLKAHGFSEGFVNGLISEVPSQFLNDSAKDNLRSQVRLIVEL